MAPSPITPRRSTRSAIFTPSPHSVRSLAAEPNTTYAWTSAPLPSGSSSKDVNYNSFTRIVSHSGVTPVKPLLGRKRPRAGREDEESRFTVGDGVSVSVEGGSEGIGVLTRLWEAPQGEDEDREDEEDGDGDDSEEGAADDDAPENRMMAEVHWCFRRQDLPGIMKNVTVEDNEVLLAASPVRPVTTHLPVRLLIKTVPIYSKQFYKEQFGEQKSKVKGWTYIRTGIYWCNRAFDKGAKGGKVWKVDVDEWREGGKKGQGWEVPLKEEAISDPTEEEESGASEDEGSEHAAEEPADSEGASEGEDEKAGRKSRKKAVPLPKRKERSHKAKGGDKATPQKRGRARRPHPQQSSSRLPAQVPSLQDLPADPYQRAMRLLHVGATPESLPCREEEFIDVLSRVEEGVESGGGGCLYIAGVPGTGKTATVHAVVKELKRKAEDGEIPPFSYVEINGLKIPSPQHAYTVLWEAISGASNASPKTALRGLEAHFSRKTGGVRGPRGHTFVVLMDELDQLLTAKQDVVYNFFNWPTMRDSQIFVVAVANRMDLPQHLAAKIKSRLGLQTLLFQPYDRQNLIDIVQSRLIAHPGSQADHKVLMPDAIALAATKMAGTNGDARRVLDACRRAVEVAADGASPSPVTAKQMMAVLNAMSSSPVAQFIRSCSTQQKLMLTALVRCVRREGVPEIPWRNLRTDHDALTRSLLDSNDLLSSSELALIFGSLVASHALTHAYHPHHNAEERKVALGMEVSEVGRVLMNEGDTWRRALAGT